MAPRLMVVATALTSLAQQPAPATLLQNGEVLVASGATDIYNPSTGKWTVGAPPLFAAGGPVRVANGNVLFFGGRSTISAAQVYNPSTNAWSKLANQTGIYVSGPLVALASGKALLAGGSTSYHSAATLAFVYDPSTNAWSETGSLLQAGLEGGVLLSNGQVVVAGGILSQQRNSHGTLSTTLRRQRRTLHAPKIGIFSAMWSLAEVRYSGHGSAADWDKCRTSVTAPSSGRSAGCRLSLRENHILSRDACTWLVMRSCARIAAFRLPQWTHLRRFHMPGRKPTPTMRA